MNATPEPAIVIRNVTKRFGDRVALSHVSLDMRSGEAVVLWGPNGAGKTTMLRCLLGILPFEGAVQVMGRSVQTDGRAVRRLIGYVPQEFGLPGDQTVAGTIAFYAELRRVPVARAMGLLGQWQLADMAATPVRALSGGMKQKLALILALLADPPVLLLDEPTSSLDLATRRELVAVLGQLKQQGKTILFCSHQVGEVYTLADRVLVLRQGCVVQEGSSEAIAASLEEPVVLGLTLHPADKTRAAALLATHGFSVYPNGRYLWVEVASARKVAPLAVLAEAKIPLLDFEVERGRIDARRATSG